MVVWILKHVRDIRTGLPRVDLSLFGDEDAARTHLDEEFISRDFEPRPPDDGAYPAAWFLGDPRLPDELVELEQRELP